MALLQWRQGHTTTTTSKLWFRCTSNVTITVVLSSGTFTGTTDTSVYDGTTVISVTGLPENTTTSFTATASNGDTASGSIRTMPPSGSTFKIGWFTCSNKDKIQIGPIIDNGCVAIMALGDNPYVNLSATRYGLSTVDVTGAADTLANLYDQHEQFMLNDGWQHATRRMAGYFMADDHERGDDDWCSDFATHGVAMGAANQAAIDTHSVNAITAIQAYHRCNPTNSDSLAAAQAPPSAVNAASNYPPLYYRFTIGNAEFFVIDCVSHRSPVGDTDNSSKTMLGTTQKAWFKDALLNSTATFKVVFTTKITYGMPGGNQNADGWKVYTTERNELLTYINANSIIGVVWLGGDQHFPHVLSYKVANGDTYNHLCVSSGPCGVALNSDIGDVGTNALFHYGPASATNVRTMGIVEVRGKEYMEISIVRSTGAVLWKGRVLPTGNVLSYPTTTSGLG